jgi:hypothetical protein
MELSLRLDMLGMVEMRYLRGRERFRDWPPFQLLAASRQAKILAYLSRDVAEQLHDQILIIESAVGLSDEDEDDDDDDEFDDDDEEDVKSKKPATEPEGAAFSPAFAQALEKLNELARQRLPESSSTGDLPSFSTELSTEGDMVGDEEALLEQLQGAFLQMMEVVRELAEEISTDALKIIGRFRCARTNIEFVQAVAEDDDDDDDDDDALIEEDDNTIDVEVELVMVLQLFEEGRSKPDDLPAVEMQLDVEDFERLHETLDIALDHDRRSRRKK